jgi:UDP-glucose 4-epimerase
VRILVTGGAGFIGSHLVDHLLSMDNDVVVLDDFSGGAAQTIFKTNSESKKISIIEGSILDKVLVSELMHNVSHCYHLAASLGVEKINRDPIGSLEVNVHGCEIVLNAAADVGVRTLLASSSEVYGKNPEMPLSEDSDRVLGSPQITRWSYSEAKALDELYAFELYKKTSFPVTIARFFNTVGPRQSGSYGMVLPRFVKAALTNQPLIAYGDGTQSRSFCSVTDVIVAIKTLMDSKATIGQAFNIGSPVEITITELANKVINLTNSKSHIIYNPLTEVYGENFEEPHRRVPDISKINRAVGWQPKKSLDEVILEVADHIRANEI